MSRFQECLPPDCQRSIDTLNVLHEAITSDICQTVQCFMQSKILAIDSAELNEKIEQSGVHIEKDELQSIVNVLKHIYRFADQHHLQNEDLQAQLVSSLKFSEKCSGCIAKSLSFDKCDGKVPKLDESSLFGVGKLVDMQWKLGVAVSSDSCKNLNSTFVSVTVKVADSSGKLSTHSFEMTVPQFKNLSKQFQEIARNMEMPNF